MNIKEAIIFGTKYLDENNISESKAKCRILLSNILNVSKEYLLVHDNDKLNLKKEMKYKEYLVRLSNNEPIQYIINKQEFMKLNFYVDENVLIPQPDTEILVEEVLSFAKKNKQKLKILDLCTGSGCIAVSIAKYIKNAEVFASDISYKALEIAKLNAKENHVKINFIESDLFENILENDFDIIISNPPYIETKIVETLEEEVKKEPILALDGGKDGLDFYRKIILQANQYLKENGILALEIGYNQKEEVIKLLEKQNYKEIYCIKDLAGNDRVIISRR